MNKLMGFYELRELSIPTIPWKEYFPGVELSDEFLWTIRSAVNHGDDLNLKTGWKNSWRSNNVCR